MPLFIPQLWKSAKRIRWIKKQLSIVQLTAQRFPYKFDCFNCKVLQSNSYWCFTSYMLSNQVNYVLVRVDDSRCHEHLSVFCHVLCRKTWACWPGLLSGGLQCRLHQGKINLSFLLYNFPFLLLQRFYSVCHVSGVCLKCRWHSNS